MNANTPTIPVKKSDGTIQYMTIPEFKEYQAKVLAPVASAPVESAPVPATTTPPVVKSALPTPAAPPKVPTMPVVASEKHLATATPVKDFFVDKAMVSAPIRQTVPKKTLPPTPPTWTPDDHASLLEEKLEYEPTTITQSAFHGDAEMAKIVAELDDLVPEALHPRLHTLLVSYQKGVRTREQVEEYLIRPLTQGGLELDVDEVEMIFGKIATAAPAKIPTKSILPETKSEPIKDAVVKSTTPSPFNFTSDGQMMPVRPAGKAVLHDVVAGSTERKVIGPVEEMRHMNLQEWRRIAGSVADRVARIQEKFETLKKESFLLFLEARAGWHESSLYQEYQQILMQSLQNRQTVDATLTQTGNAKTFTVEELNGIIEINRYLSF